MHKLEHLKPTPILSYSPFPDPNLTFLGDCVKPYDRRRNRDFDIGFVGVPFDGGVTSHRRGARFGPRYVREALYNNSDYCCDHDVEFSKMRLVDFGDVDMGAMSFGKTQERIREVFERIYSLGGTIVAIGGDHSIASPIIQGLCANLGRGKKLGIIDLDSHHDTRSEYGENSGQWAREILEIPTQPVSGHNLVQIGIHGYRYSRSYHDQLKKFGIRVYTPLDIRRRGMEETIAEALEAASDGTDALYLSVDIDVLDQVFAPGASATYPGGLMPQDVMVAVYEAGKHPLTRGMDLVEVSPPLDPSGGTSRMGAELLLYFLCGYSGRD